MLQKLDTSTIPNNDETKFPPRKILGWIEQDAMKPKAKSLYEQWESRTSLVYILLSSKFAGALKLNIYTYTGSRRRGTSSSLLIIIIIYIQTYT
jgi:hypothetical protein